MIKKFLSNAMLSIVMDKQAKEKFRTVRENRKSREKAEPPSTDSDTAPVAGVARSETLNRKDLIRNAMALHKEKSKVFDDLNEGEKKRLELLALKMMIDKGNR